MTVPEFEAMVGSIVTIFQDTANSDVEKNATLRSSYKLSKKMVFRQIPSSQSMEKGKPELKRGLHMDYVR